MNLEKTRLVRDKVLIRVDEREGVTSGGIVLPQQYGPPPGSGTVVKVGPGRHVLRGGVWVFVPTRVKPGDRVGYRWIDVGESRKFEIEGRDHVFLREDEIYLIVSREEEAAA